MCVLQGAAFQVIKTLLNSSEEKEKSSTGWPSFAKGASESALTEEVTSKKHKEVTCSKVRHE